MPEWAFLAFLQDATLWFLDSGRLRCAPTPGGFLWSFRDQAGDVFWAPSFSGRWRLLVAGACGWAL